MGSAAVFGAGVGALVASCLGGIGSLATIGLSGSEGWTVGL